MPGLDPHGIAEKAETRLSFSDLESLGGALNVKQMDAFRRLVQAEAKLPGDNDVKIIKQKKMKVEAAGFPTRMTFPVDEHDQIAEEKYVKLVPNKVDFNCQKYAGAHPLSEEVKRNNLMRGQIGPFIMQEALPRLALDIEEYGLLSDTGHVDPDFAKFDGLLVQPTSHVINPDTAQAVTAELWHHMRLALPAKYWRDLDNMRYYCSPTTEAVYAYWLGEKVIGEAYRDQEKDRGYRLRFEGVPIFPIPCMPAGYSILTHRKNIMWAIEQALTWEFEREAKKDRDLIHFRYAMDVEYVVEDGVVIHKNVAQPVVPTT